MGRKSSYEQKREEGLVGGIVASPYYYSSTCGSISLTFLRLPNLTLDSYLPPLENHQPFSAPPPQLFAEDGRNVVNVMTVHGSWQETRLMGLSTLRCYYYDEGIVKRLAAKNKPRKSKERWCVWV